VRDVVKRMLKVEYINYNIPSRFNPETDTVDDDNGLCVPVDFEAEQIAEDALIADEVVAAVMTWQFKPVLTTDEYNRLTQINVLLSQQVHGKTVSTANLKRVFTTQEYEEYEQSLTIPITIAEVLYADGVPKELKRYNLMLRDADFHYYKFEKMSALKSTRRAFYKSETLTKIHNKSEHLYDHALEYLQESIELSEQNREGDKLRRWLDRDVVFGEHNNTSLDVDGVPRVKGSRSHSAQDAGLPKLSVRLKREQRVLEHLLRAAISCAYVPEVVPDVQVTTKLKQVNWQQLNPEKD
jgi:hypothetical protein